MGTSPVGLAHLRRQLTERLGPHVGVACTDVHGDPEGLHAEERSAIGGAIPRRQREYAAGRNAARQAMAAIGWPSAAVPSALDRSPIWPSGLVGSIAHTHSACVAVVTRQQDVAAIGIDLEDDEPIESDLWHTICTPAELAFLMAQPTPLRGVLVRRLFAIKEAVYKCQFPLTKRLLDFQEVEVVFEPVSTPSSFQAIIDGPPAPTNLTGFLLPCDHQIAACCILLAGSGTTPPSIKHLLRAEDIA
jgi:enterobactin synthetase component D